jgi:hypothetical protein
MIEAAADANISEQETAAAGRDERDGRPSASAMERISLCPGSHAASLGIPERQSEAASRGNRIHALAAGEKVEDASQEERDSAASCEELAKNVIESTLGVPINDCDEVWRERRLWAKDLRFSGKPDLVVVSGDEAVIVDYKTGAGDVTEASGNIQLRALAVLVQQNTMHDLECITVVIIQPLASQRISVCRYDKSDMAMAGNEARIIVEAAGMAGAARFAGAKQCKYCPARSRCPEALASMSELLSIPSPTRATQLSASDLELALDRCDQVESVIEALREEAKQRIAFGEPLRGWVLRPGVQREMVKDTTEVFSRYMLAGGTEQAFLSATSVSKSGLKEALRAVTALKGKQLDEKVQSILEGCTERTQPSVRLVRERLVKE